MTSSGNGLQLVTSPKLAHSLKFFTILLNVRHLFDTSLLGEPPGAARGIYAFMLHCTIASAKRNWLSPSTITTSEWWANWAGQPRLRSPGIQKQLGLPLATGVSVPCHHIRSDAWPEEFWVACCETTECQIENALVHIDDALVRIEADTGAAL